MLVTVYKWLKSVLNYRSYPKNKTGYPVFWATQFISQKMLKTGLDMVNTNAMFLSYTSMAGFNII